jgi:RNA polymerase sigma-70 factor (ECF subfamily)
MEAPGPIDRRFAEFLRSGDPAALGEVYDAVAPRLLQLAIHLVRDPGEAEDVLQATFVAALERCDSFDPARPVLPWLTGILGVEARRARARRARTPDPERLAKSEPNSPIEDAERAELLERLDASLERVPEAFRAVLVLRLRHGLTVPEIAAALGRAPGTVRSQLARGVERLRTTLPAGLAHALVAWTGTRAGTDPSHALAAIREQVLAHALHFPGPWTLTAATGLGGLLAMKKLVAAAAAAVVGVLLWNVARSGARTDAADATAATPTTPLVAAQAPVERAPVARPEPVETAPVDARVAVEPTVEEPAEPPVPHSGGVLEIVATWPGDEPAAGEVVAVRNVAEPSWTPALELRTDDRGHAAVDLEPGHYHCSALRGGEGNHAVVLGETTVARFELTEGLEVQGLVVDVRGDPVAGAEIWMSERYRTDRGVVVTRSDAAGRFQVRGLIPEHHLGARKAGYAPSALRTARAGSGSRIDLTLELLLPGGRLVGHVLDDDGAPIAGAAFLLGSEATGLGPRLPDGSFAPPPPPQLTWTDDQGRFEVPWAPLGPSPWQARATGLGLARGTIEVLEGVATPLEVRLTRAASVSGRVVDAAGEPLTAVWIHAGRPGGFDESRAWSTSDGRFTLEHLPAGSIELVAKAREGGEARETVTLRAGETHEWNPRVLVEGRIEGFVRDEAGRPLAELVVVAIDPKDRGTRSRSERTDAEGHFRITELDDVAHELWVQAPMGWRQFPHARLEEVWPDGPPVEVVVPDAERAFARLRLEVVTEDGSPVDDAELQVYHLEQRLWRSLVASEAGGPILVEHVPPGSVQLEVRHAEYPWLPLGTRTVSAGEELDLGRVTLTTPAHLRVLLRGPADRMEGLTWLVTDDQGREAGVLERHGDELTSGPLKAGRHRLTVRGDFLRLLRREVELRAGVEELVEVELEPCGMREVRFTLPADQRPRWIALSVFDGEQRLVWSGNADAESSPPVARVSAPPGEYTLWAGGEGDLSGRAPLVIESLRGAEPPLTIALAPR